MHLKLLILSLFPTFILSIWFKNVPSGKESLKELKNIEATTALECATQCSLHEPMCNGFYHLGIQCIVGELDLCADDVTADASTDKLCKFQTLQIS